MSRCTPIMTPVFCSPASSPPMMFSLYLAVIFHIARLCTFAGGSCHIRARSNAMTVANADLEKLLPDLTRFARVLTRNEDDAHDLVQDCVERALRKHELYQDGTSLKSWLFTLMRNLFVSQK